MTRRASGVIKADTDDVMAATRSENSRDDDGRVMRGKYFEQHQVVGLEYVAVGEKGRRKRGCAAIL